jgi:peptidoglycan hydrolase-like protein with peptidoglycan-binding domain
MSKDWQPNRNPSNDFPGADNRSKSKPEVDKSSIYGNSLGYGSSLGYGNSLGYGSSLGYTPGLGYGPSLESRPSPEGIAQAKKSTGNPHTLDWNRVTTESSQKLTTPANGGESLVNQDFNNNLAVNSKNTSSANKQLDSNSQDIQLVSTSLIPGVGYRIEAPNLDFEDPNFQFLLAVKTLVDIFGFEQRDAHQLIYDLLTKKRPIGIYGVGIIYGSKGPNGRPMIQMSVESKMVTYYTDMAARLKQQRSNQQNNQRTQNEQREKQRSELRNSYVNALKGYTNDVRLKIRAFIAQLDKDNKAFLEREAQDIYRRIATNSKDTELAEAIMIEVAYKHFRDQLQNFVRGSAPKQQQQSSQPQQQQQSSQPQQRQPSRQRQQQQPSRQPPNHNETIRWQATARSFQEQFATNFSREQIIVIQQLVGARPDGNYGEETARKVYQWQQKHGVPNPDGLVGNVTRRAMVAQLRRTKNDDAALLESSKPSNAPAVTSQVTETRTQNNTVPVTDSSSNEVALLESSKPSNAPAVTSQVTGTRTQSNTVPVTDSSSNAEKASLTERATPSNLNEEIDLYQTALLQEIPQISARLQAGLNSKVFNQETVAAWHRLSELMIRLYPAAKASNVDPKLSQAIADAGSQLFEGLLQQVSNTSTTDGRVGMRRLLPPALAGAGKKIAELVAQNNWNGLYQQYFEFAITFDNWLQEGSNYRAGNETQLKADRAGTERVEYLRGMGQQLQKFKTESTDTNPVRLIADFYPQEKASEGSANQLEKIPLSLYLGQKESQFLGQTNNQWILTQITPKNAIDVSVPKKPEETNPPQELFDKLNSPNRFPKGIIRYTLPNGVAGVVEVDGNWKLSDWLAFIGLGAGLAALTIFTLGSGTVVVSTIGYPLLYLGAAAQVGSSVANIGERSRDGTINPMQVSLDAVNIVSAVTGVGATTAGRFALDASRSAQAGAPYRGMMAKLAIFADGWFVPLTGANLAADGATVVLMSADAYRQSQEIWQGSGEEGDKRKAMALLIAQLAVTGGLLTLSLKGNIADLRDGQRLVLGIDENGVPVARSREQTGETSPAARTTEESETTPTQETSRTGAVDFTTKRTLSEKELKAYMEKANFSWKELKKEVLEKANNMELMLQFTAYRKRVFKKYVDDIKNHFNNRVEGVLSENSEGGDFKSVIAGSDQPSSDYDATFVSPTGDKRVELEAVIEFNLRFRGEFGKESGTVFDTNVYTSGHTLPSSMGDRLNEVLAMGELEELFNLPRALAEDKNNLTTLQGPARKELEDKINKKEQLLPQREQKIRDKINEINELRRANPNSTQEELLSDNIHDLEAGQIRKQKESVQIRLTEEVGQEKTQNRTSEAAQAQLAADQDVMALLKQRRYMTDEEWLGSTNQAGERGGGYRDRMLASTTDESVRVATAARLDKADEIYNRATQELHQKIVELNRNKSSKEQVLDTNGAPETDVTKIMTANEDAQLEAFNRLYEHYLRKAQDKRDLLENYKKRRSRETPPTLGQEQLDGEIDRLTIELNEMQSKALFFANEAYHTGPAVEHVVLRQQLKLGIPIEIDEYLVSINEQVGFAMEQVTADKSLGKALWKSAKYMQRVTYAITEITKKSDGLFDSKAQARNDKMRDLFEKLLAIKKEEGKYYKMNDEQKSAAAIEVAQSEGFNFGSAENLRQELLKFNIELNTEIRNARSGQYKTHPSSLNSWPAASTNQSSSKNFPRSSEKLAQSPAKNLELAEFG